MTFTKDGHRSSCCESAHFNPFGCPPRPPLQPHRITAVVAVSCGVAADFTALMAPSLNRTDSSRALQPHGTVEALPAVPVRDNLPKPNTVPCLFRVLQSFAVAWCTCTLGMARCVFQTAGGAGAAGGAGVRTEHTLVFVVHLCLCPHLALCVLASIKFCPACSDWYPFRCSARPQTPPAPDTDSLVYAEKLKAVGDKREQTNKFMRSYRYNLGEASVLFPYAREALQSPISPLDDMPTEAFALLFRAVSNFDADTPTRPRRLERDVLSTAVCLCERVERMGHSGRRSMTHGPDALVGLWLAIKLSQ